MYIIYKTTNTTNGKYYIGVTNGNNKTYKGSGTALLNAMKEHGRENFIREDLEVFDTAEEAYQREQEIVNQEFVEDRQTYNTKLGGKGGLGHKKSSEHRKKISEAIKNKLKTDDNYRSNTGRKPSMDLDLLISTVEEHGVKEAANILDLTFYQCRDRYRRAIKPR